MAEIALQERDQPPQSLHNCTLKRHQDEARESWALFSDCGLYRYRLRRVWGGGKRVAFLMLNPSKADEIKNDPTIERVERRARALGYGGFEAVNIFALRSTDPKGLRQVRDPVGALNEKAIKAAIASTDDLVCAWGAHGDYLSQGAQIRALVESIKPEFLHFGLTKYGHPRHPLYIGYAVAPQQNKA